MFTLSDTPIDTNIHSRSLYSTATGAVVSFEGRVRQHNLNRQVVALEYSAYPALANKVGMSIVSSEVARHQAIAAVAVHRTGRLEPGALAVWCAVASTHRQAAFACAAAIVERLKYELPVWKKEHYDNRDSGWIGPDNQPADQAQDIPVWDATLEAIHISAGHDFRGRHGLGRLTHDVSSPLEVECLPGRGLRGDRYSERADNHGAQVTFFDAATVDALRERCGMPGLSSAAFRRNLVVRGVSLAAWIGRRFRFQGVLFEGVEECRPCYWMDEAIGPGTEDFLKDNARGGLRARILSPGILQVTP